MALKPLSELVSGMVLIKGVKDHRGRLLLGEGGEITDRHLRLFKMWGVAEADVEPAPEGTSSQQGQPGAGAGSEGGDNAQAATAADDPKAARQKALREKLAHRFRHTDLKHPVTKQLVKISLGWASASGGDESDG